MAAFSGVVVPGRRLRGYQVEPARAIAESVLGGLGRQFAVVFSRQAGKDELLAQVIAFLLARYRRRGGGIVVAAPTFRPQAALSRDRLLDRLAGSALGPGTRVREGYAVPTGGPRRAFSRRRRERTRGGRRPTCC